MKIVNFMKSKKGFTLVELLVVVGILGVLAISALVALNPAEAQRKSRDSVRLQDLAVLSGAIEQYINDNGTALLPGNVVSSTTATRGAQGCAAASNWLTIDLCAYMKSIPRDPSNGQRIGRVTGSNTITTVARVNATGGYRFVTTALGYELCVYMEAQANAPKPLNDGGNNNNIFEAGSDLTAACVP